MGPANQPRPPRHAAIRTTLVHQPDNAVEYATFFSRSHDAVIQVYDAGLPNP